MNSTHFPPNLYGKNTGKDLECVFFYGTKEQQNLDTFEIENEEVKNSYFKFSTRFIIVEIWMNVPKGCKEPTLCHVIALRVQGLLLKSGFGLIKQTFPVKTLSISTCNDKYFGATHKFEFLCPFNNEPIECSSFIKKISNLMIKQHKDIFLQKVFDFTNPKVKHDYWKSKIDKIKSSMIKILATNLLSYTPSSMINKIMYRIFKKPYKTETKLVADFQRAACYKHIPYAKKALFPMSFTLLSGVSESDFEGDSDNENSIQCASGSKELLLTAESF